MISVELPIFIRCAEILFTDEDLAELQLTLLKNPFAGDLVRGGKGPRKLRVGYSLDVVKACSWLSEPLHPRLEG
jgi:hypothetical protein